jgi:alginate O-acetyltransferase complex protein AlgI
MLFNSASFLVFFTAVLALYAALRGTPARKVLLLVASYLFYAHWDWRYLGLLLFSTGMDFLIAARMFRAEGRRRRLWLCITLASNLGILAVFKYGNFVLANLARFVPALSEHLAAHGPPLPVAIPIGISFYTFQSLSYTLDVYLRRSAPSRSLLDFALYVAFFPQLVAGPIVRSTEFLPQIEHLASPRAEEVAAGIQRFILGLFKKVVVADHAALFVDRVFTDPGGHAGLLLLGATYAFALQIYLDFSAYTDMAIGVARAFDVRLPENFDAPYLASSITDFWRRWHISLSSWLRDYLYIPLGGSRRGRGRTYVNLLLTMLLGGLWHGAAWSFLLWGAYHGALLALERRFPLLRGGEVQGPLERAVRTAVTLHLVCLGWIFFRAGSLENVGTFLARLFSAWEAPDEGARVALAWSGALFALILLQLVGRHRDLFPRLWARAPAVLQGAALAAVLLFVAVYRVSENAFIYFQF